MDSSERGAIRRPVSVLLLTSVLDDRFAFTNASEILGFKIACFQRWHHLIEAVRPDALNVIACEQQMCDVDWRTIAEQVRTMGDRATFVVIADRVSGRLASEVHRAGGAGVLIRPLRLTRIDGLLERMLSRGKVDSTAAQAISTANA